MGWLPFAAFLVITAFAFVRFVRHCLLRQYKESSSTEETAPPLTTINCAGLSPCDVFLSHRGPDVKRNFVSFLHNGLVKAGLTGFVDELNLKPSDPAWEVIIANLRVALIKMPIISVNFGDSYCCLEELVIMMGDPLSVMPIFYHPDFHKLKEHVLKQIWRNHKRGQPGYRDRAKRYIQAVGKVFDINGLRLDQHNNDSAALARSVVRAVLGKLGYPALYVAEHPVDIDRRVEALSVKLRAQTAAAGGRAVALGLWGMGGIGKTTLAKALYNKLRNGFNDHCFVEVGQAADNARLMFLQQQLLEALCGISNTNIYTIDQGKARLQQHMRNKRMLLVVDDIWTAAQADALLGALQLGDEVPVIGSGSCICVTSRDKDMLRGYGMREHQIEEVQQLPTQAATKLFRYYAFGQGGVPNSLELFVSPLVTACNGLPLTLQVVGSFLRGKGEQHVWDCALARLRSAKPLNNADVDGLWSVLKLSFDCLDAAAQRLFLDMACFPLGSNWPWRCQLSPIWLPLGFTGQTVQRNGRIVNSSTWLPPGWEDRADASTTLENLFYKSLVHVKKTTWGDQLYMHDQLRSMGRAIACAKGTHVGLLEAQDLLSMSCRAQTSNVEYLSLRQSYKVGHSSTTPNNVLTGRLPMCVLPQLRILECDGCSQERVSNLFCGCVWRQAYIVIYGRYDIHLTYRNPDVKFIGLLHDSLSRAGLSAFSGYSLKPGQSYNIIPASVQAARIRMPIISADFGECYDCLDELAMMMEDPSAVIMPIFIDISNHGIGDLVQQVLREIRKCQEHGRPGHLEHGERYIRAIHKVSYYSGFLLSRYNWDDAALAQAVVHAVSNSLGYPPL